TIKKLSHFHMREVYATLFGAMIIPPSCLSNEQEHRCETQYVDALIGLVTPGGGSINQVTEVKSLSHQEFDSGDWQKDFPNDASPFYSFPSFLVRTGNPKGIKDWDDLARDDVNVVFPNPKTSGNARYTYLAATAYAKEKFNGDEAKVQEFVKKI